MSNSIYLAKNPLHKLFVGFDPLYNLKYLFVSIKEGRRLKQYKGSGSRWEKNIRYRRDEIKKICIFKSRDPYIFMRKCVETSLRFNIVESDEWANQIIEMGNTGIGSPFGVFHHHHKKCKHCKKSFDPGNFAQFHGDNCLLNPKRNSALPLVPVDTTTKRRLAIQRRLQKTRDFLESLGLPGVVKDDLPVMKHIYKKLILRYKDEVCFEWRRENTKNNIQLGFATFVRDMGEKPTREDGSILYNWGVCRKDEELPFNKDNCYWGNPQVELKSCKTYCDLCDRWFDKGNYIQHCKFSHKSLPKEASAA